MTTDCELIAVFQANTLLSTIAPPLPTATPIAPPSRFALSI